MWPIPQYIRSVKHISTSTVSHIQTKTGKGPKFTNDLACTCILLPWRLYVSYSLPKIWLTCSILWIKCHIINIHNGFVIIISTPKTTYFSSHKKKTNIKNVLFGIPALSDFESWHNALLGHSGISNNDVRTATEH